MYSAMLVEDEDDLRGTYKAMKTWGRNGFSITSEAENGVRALELLEKVSVDVVFTDIRMPLMDGITLMKQAAEKYPGLLFVFVSAHHNFCLLYTSTRASDIDCKKQLCRGFFI